ncbi:MAG: PP2C family protein-serine/threonine phosphatase [Jatrophihabitans sp.]|uniref:PP2C family protein-serine/threonine phosphatase n=1 Tax=Jatrophihabitans sp. TaxID=1932789 RepID=UPI0039149363
MTHSRAPLDAATDPARGVDPDVLREQRRMAAVRRYDILDTPPDGAFDRIAALAARLLNVPIAIVSVVDTDRIWFKSHHGLDVTEIGRAPGLCASAILGSEPWLVTDAKNDPRTLTNPLVAGDFGLRFYAGAPLTTHDGHNLGTLCAIDMIPRPISEQETAILTDLAALVMDELELRLSAGNALLTARQRLEEVEHLATAFQASLLPPRLPDIPHVQLAAVYQPVDRHQVGGDFYDAFPIDEHAWVIAIGDVCGTGPAAAARTSSARFSIRACAVQHRSPSDVLQTTNLALATDNTTGNERPFVTALVARIEPHPQRTLIQLASAGHPLPLLLRHDGEVQSIGQPGQPLGILSTIESSDTTVDLAPGDTLVLHTDGLADSGRPHRLGEDGLQRLLASCHGMNPDQIVARLHQTVADAPRDDIAILAIACAA